MQMIPPVTHRLNQVHFATIAFGFEDSLTWFTSYSQYLVSHSTLPTQHDVNISLNITRA